MWAEVTMMRFHGPGWTLELEGAQYKLWAPQTDVMRDPERFPGMWSTDGVAWHSDDRTPRAHWAACWTEVLEDEDALPDGDFRKGSTLEEVLAMFPRDVRAQFKAARGGSAGARQ